MTKQWPHKSYRRVMIIIRIPTVMILMTFAISIPIAVIF